MLLSLWEQSKTLGPKGHNCYGRISAWTCCLDCNFVWLDPWLNEFYWPTEPIKVLHGVYSRVMCRRKELELWCELKIWVRIFFDADIQLDQTLKLVGFSICGGLYIVLYFDWVKGYRTCCWLQLWRPTKLNFMTICGSSQTQTAKIYIVFTFQWILKSYHSIWVSRGGFDSLSIW